MSSTFHTARLKLKTSRSSIKLSTITMAFVNAMFTTTSLIIAPKLDKPSQKLGHPGSFTLRCKIGSYVVDNALCDLGASVSIIPNTVVKRQGLRSLRPCNMRIQLAGRSWKFACGMLEDITVQVGMFSIPGIMSRKINEFQGYKMKSRSAENRFLVRAVSKDINFDQYSSSALQADVIEDDDGDTDDEFSPRGRFRRNSDEENKDYDRDPEFADILGSCLDDPERARSKMEERLRSKRNKILHTKTGSGIPMNVTFNKFGFSNSYIWFEFYNVPLEKDVSLICNAIRSWHILGRLGGCNSLNMQLSQSIMEKRPSYDAIQGANVTPTTFYNIGDFEIQDKLARIWVDIGTAEPLLLDILINAFTQISSDYIGIKQLVFGGTEFENWKENMTSEAAGYTVHKI